jgi:hypothetical protein
MVSAAAATAVVLVVVDLSTHVRGSLCKVKESAIVLAVARTAAAVCT